MSKSSETSELSRLPMTTLQKGLALYCKLLDLSKQTCLALTLMLDTKELLLAMLKFMAIIESRGLKPEITDDMTTIASNLAADLRTISDKRAMNST